MLREVVLNDQKLSAFQHNSKMLTNSMVLLLFHIHIDHLFRPRKLKELRNAVAVPPSTEAFTTSWFRNKTLLSTVQKKKK